MVILRDLHLVHCLGWCHIMNACEDFKVDTKRPRKKN